MRVGFLGVGAAAYEHALCVEALGHEVAVASARDQRSPRWERFQTRFPRAVFVDDGARLLADPTLDAVVAALSWDVTEQWLERLLTSPRPILIEKPVALASRPLRAALTQAGAIAANKRVGYNRRFYEPVLVLRDRLRAGGLRSTEVCIAEDLQAHLHKHGPSLVPHLDLFSSHILDLTLHLLGPLRLQRRYAHLGRSSDAGGLCVSALLETAQGQPLWLSRQLDDPSPVGMRLRFDDGTTWCLSPLERLTVYRGTDVLPAEPPLNIRRYVPRLESESLADHRFKPGFLAQMRSFLAGLEGATLPEALALTELAESLQGRGAA